MKRKKTILAINNNRVGEGISGGDQIFIQFLKNFSGKNEISVLACQETVNLLKTDPFAHLKIFLTDKKVNRANLNFPAFIFHVLRRTFLVIKVLKTGVLDNQSVDYVFSSSDFYPDVIPALYLKLKHPQTKWIAAFYMFAPRPLSKNNPYSKSFSRFLTGLFYYLTQKLIYFFILKKADFVLLCNDLDKHQFIKDGFKNKNLFVIYGGIDLKAIKKVRPAKRKIYDGVFMARFHEQKGPAKFIEIIIQYLNYNSQAKFAMIGDGPEMVKVKRLIKKNHLENTVTLFGFLNNERRYQILKQSKVFLHTAIYETGGMSVAEGMACGLPVIAFHHPGFKYIYPKGLLTTKKQVDINDAAVKMRQLLTQKKLYQKLQKEAFNLVSENWDWQKRFLVLQKRLFQSKIGNSN